MQLRGIETLEHIVSNNIPVVFAPNVPDNCVLKLISQVFIILYAKTKYKIFLKYTLTSMEDIPPSVEAGPCLGALL